MAEAQLPGAVPAKCADTGVVQVDTDLRHDLWHHTSASGTLWGTFGLSITLSTALDMPLRAPAAEAVHGDATCKGAGAGHQLERGQCLRSLQRLPELLTRGHERLQSETIATAAFNLLEASPLGLEVH
jgi:hypothetical protein